MTLALVLLALAVAGPSAGIGYLLGRYVERVETATHHDPAPHEVLADLDRDGWAWP